MTVDTGAGARGGVETARAAAHEASRSRIDTPALARGGVSSRSEAGMDASWARGRT
ncbi:hypothetical protein [Streptomyces avermitilis]|uniref:hypothetical protein n=1 Tax=Streptomyces avermitilis TaxID=33903 RepID=UPI0036803DA3